MCLRLLRAAALAVALGCAALPAAAQTGADPRPKSADDPVIARVDGTEIKRSDLVAARRALPEQYRRVALQSIYQPLLRQMINTLLIAGAARAEGLGDDPDVRREMATMEDQILERAYLKRIVESKVTEEVLREDYQKTIARADSGAEVKVRARHILVKTEAEAVAIIAELGAGKADFAELARKKSTGPSGKRGGDLGFFGRGDMAKPFSEAVFKLKPGEVAGKPVKTRFGWHVIKLEERRAGSAPSFEESRDKLSAARSERVIAETLGMLRKGATIETFGLDGSAAAPAPIKRVP